MSDEARNFRKSIRVGGVWIRAIGKNVELLVELEDGWHLCATELLESAFGHIVEPSGIINAPKDYLDTAPRPAPAAPAATPMAATTYRCKECGMIGQFPKNPFITPEEEAELAKLEAKGVKWVQSGTDAVAMNESTPQKLPAASRAGHSMANADRLHIMEIEFLERHKDADLLVCDTKTGKVHEAIYHSMWKKISDDEKRFWRLVAEAMVDEDEHG